ncbi:MAG: sulfopyruvate decarboxylase subunit beta [Nitrospinaceae bacterium]|nr:sulfopyruvate decarboxylase subunit beta [Nitrospinaceae bacterium]NIS83846.1 sulfopyruvate decarboxylase subunit beta [Nitrospinaceae bacterium]NIT80637.1 sulfopyruvate decarboxylase subunit beta [Nitrospinaceae bacterium]NIU95042.1 sulfopyruvate decarboxylase subunit beta [Nitrospinaceae bacterium]NIY13661.1 sulfopyruvate decarboxylase subunit beta [Nitrospinaceae bacterium]
MTGTEAFETLIPLLREEAVIHANGYICRESFRLKDRDGNFYMIGSMGLASSIGLGVAMGRPEKKVIVFDGDGNVLMALGTLAMIAAAAPENFLHVVFDNQVYESTGKQRSISPQVPLDEVARSAGYRHTRKVSRHEDLEPAFLELRESEGPSFLLVDVAPSFQPGTGRVTHSPEEIKTRFMKSLQASAALGK